MLCSRIDWTELNWTACPEFFWLKRSGSTPPLNLLFTAAAAVFVAVVRRPGVCWPTLRECVCVVDWLPQPPPLLSFPFAPFYGAKRDFAKPSNFFWAPSNCSSCVCVCVCVCVHSRLDSSSRICTCTVSPRFCFCCSVRVLWFGFSDSGSLSLSPIDSSRAQSEQTNLVICCFSLSLSLSCSNFACLSVCLLFLALWSHRTDDGGDWCDVTPCRRVLAPFLLFLLFHVHWLLMDGRSTSSSTVSQWTERLILLSGRRHHQSVCRV